MSSIRLHREHGLNPTIPVCHFCHQDKREIALLGAAYKDQAPMHMIIDKNPCDECLEKSKKGVFFAIVTTPEGNTTGQYFVLYDDAVRRIFLEEMADIAIKQRFAYIDLQIAADMGLFEMTPTEVDL